MSAKIGQEYHSLSVEEDGTHSWSLYRVRSIMKRKAPIYGNESRTVEYVYATLVESWTWGKRSKKAGDYGWLDPIPAWCRHKWRSDEEPRGMFKTKKAAIKDELRSHKENMLPEDYPDPAMFDKITVKLENMLKRV